MLRVLFFGRLREDLGCSELEIVADDSCRDLDALQAQLCAANGERWARALGAANTIRALNQEMVSGNPPLADGDAVAFFPPVTGG